MRRINVNIVSGACKPDFEGPSTSGIDDDYEYEIGTDKDIVVKFKDASNGDCFFESELEVEGPSKTIYLYRPEILVQNAVFKNLYKKIADASVTISARSSADAGDYKFTYIMHDRERNVKERIKFKVEIIAPEEDTAGLFGSAGGSSRSSKINGDDSSSTSDGESGTDGGSSADGESSSSN